MSDADWYTDPVGTHEYRFWDGGRWTEHVSNGGVQGTDSPPADLPAPLRLDDPGPAVGNGVAPHGRHAPGQTVTLAPPTASAPMHGQTVEYKVLTQKDRALSRKFDPYVLEEALNAYAREGWRVVSSATAEFPGFLSGQREELIVVMERRR